MTVIQMFVMVDGQNSVVLIHKDQATMVLVEKAHASTTVLEVQTSVTN